MARGRMINNAISRDKDISDLSSDSCRLFFTWWIAHADKEGRVYADPDLAKSTVVPRLKHISADDVAGYIKELDAAGFIQLYEVDGDVYAAFIEFEKNQVGLRKDREPDSEIPAPPIRQPSDNLPTFIPVNLKEVKLNKVNLREDNSDAGINQYSLDNAIEYSKAATIYMTVTGNMALPMDQKKSDKVIDSITSIWYIKGDNTIEYLKPFFQEWINRKYSKTNPAWLDWAASNETPLLRDSKGKVVSTSNQQTEAEAEAIAREMGML